MKSNDNEQNTPYIGKLSYHEVDVSANQERRRIIDEDTETEKLSDRNLIPIVELGPHDMYVHMQHGLRGELDHMPRARGASGDIMMYSCSVDHEKARVIAEYVTETPDGQENTKGIGVYHTNGNIHLGYDPYNKWEGNLLEKYGIHLIDESLLADKSFRDHNYIQKTKFGFPFIRTFRNGDRDYGEDKKFRNSEGKLFTFERNPYCNAIFISELPNDCFLELKKAQNREATALLDKVLTPFYHQYALLKEISKEQLMEKIDTLAQRVGILNDNFIKNFKQNCLERVLQIGKAPLFPKKCQTKEGAKAYLKKLHINFYKGVYDAKDYEYLTKAFCDQIPGGQEILNDFQKDDEEKIEISIISKAGNDILKKLDKSFKTNHIDQKFLDNTLESAISHDIKEHLNLHRIHNPKLRAKLEEILKEKFTTSLKKTAQENTQKYFDNKETIAEKKLTELITPLLHQHKESQITIEQLRERCSEIAKKIGIEDKEFIEKFTNTHISKLRESTENLPAIFPESCLSEKGALKYLEQLYLKQGIYTVDEYDYIIGQFTKSTNGARLFERFKPLKTKIINNKVDEIADDLIAEYTSIESLEALYEEKRISLSKEQDQKLNRLPETEKKAYLRKLLKQLPKEEVNRIVKKKLINLTEDEITKYLKKEQIHHPEIIKQVKKKILPRIQQGLESQISQDNITTKNSQSITAKIENLPSQYKLALQETRKIREKWISGAIDTKMYRQEMKAFFESCTINNANGELRNLSDQEAEVYTNIAMRFSLDNREALLQEHNRKLHKLPGAQQLLISRTSSIRDRWILGEIDTRTYRYELKKHLQKEKVQIREETPNDEGTRDILPPEVTHYMEAIMQYSQSNRQELLDNKLKILKQSLETTTKDTAEVRAYKVAKLLEPFQNIIEDKQLKAFIRKHIPLHIRRHIFPKGISKEQLSTFFKPYKAIEQQCFGENSLAINEAIIALKTAEPNTDDYNNALDNLNKLITRPETPEQRAQLKKLLKVQLGLGLYKTLKPELDCLSKQKTIGKLSYHEVDTLIDTEKDRKIDDIEIEKLSDRNLIPVVELGPHDMYVHIQHTSRGTLNHMPRARGANGDIMMFSCSVDHEKARVIAEYVTETPDGQENAKGVGVYHSNGNVLVAYDPYYDCLLYTSDAADD